MTITIRNSELEATIRRIGERTGEEPETVILRLVLDEAADDGVPAEAEVKRRLDRMAALRQKFPPAEPRAAWADVEAEMGSIFGDDLR